jgi:uncharacterized membrane protein
MDVRRVSFGVRATIRRAFAEFLALPTAVIVGFLLLAVASYALDRASLERGSGLRAVLESHVFGSPEASADLLRTIATGLITVTSITISLLLLAVQQSSTSMTTEVLDQFLRRRVNQLYFGTFVGLALYALITLATVSRGFNPVYGAAVAFLLTVLALFLLIVLLYTTLNQMRSVEIVGAIHRHTLVARTRQRRFIAKTRAEPRLSAAVRRPVTTERHGFVTRVELEALGAAAERGPGAVEIVLAVSIGAFVAYGDVLAEVAAETAAAAEAAAAAVRAAVQLEIQRDIALDPGYGIEQIETIAWTSISTSKSNPSPGILGVRSLRDLLARWSVDEQEPRGDASVPVVYVDDVMPRLMSALESLAVVASESMQHRTVGEVLRALAATFDRLQPADRRRAEDVVLRVMSALGDHVLTADLDAALNALARTLAAAGSVATATAVGVARDALAASVGRLGSRATRAPRVA